MAIDTNDTRETSQTEAPERIGRHVFDPDSPDHQWPAGLTPPSSVTYDGRHRDYMREDVSCGYGHIVERRELLDHQCPGRSAAAERGRALIERIQQSVSS